MGIAVALDGKNSTIYDLFASTLYEKGLILLFGTA